MSELNPIDTNHLRLHETNSLSGENYLAIIDVSDIDYTYELKNFKSLRLNFIAIIQKTIIDVSDI